MQWALDLVLILLLGATLFQAVRLERALGVLKRDRGALEDLVAGFNDSTRQAEQGVERLRGAADGAGRQLARQIDSSNALKDDLAYLSDRGEKLADRLDALVRSARLAAPGLPAAISPAAIPTAAVPSGSGPYGSVPLPHSPAPPAGPTAAYAPDAMEFAMADDENAPQAMPPSPRAQALQPPTRLPSKAERDLVRALRLGR